MKFSYAVKKFFNSKNKYALILILAIAVVIISTSYAMFTTTVESKGSLNIVTGKLYTKMTSTGLDSDNEVVVAPTETKEITINLKNVNPVAAKYNLYYSLSKANANVEIGYTSADIAPVQEGFVIESGDTKTIKVKITNNEETDNITVSFGTKVGLQNKELTFPANKLVLVGLSPIVAAYTYDYDATNNPTGCITGEEATCQETTCYETKTAGACPAGTIIKYKVNDSEEKYFHVLHDDGEKITMQQRENTIANTAWYSSAMDNSQGPTTVLPVLENATSGWTNVNDLSYTLGTDTLYQNSATGCANPGEGNALTCSDNTYTLGKRTAKARMITGQETAVLGCKFGTVQSCPNWMNNYLYDATSDGGTVVAKDSNGNNTYGYYTMSAYSSNSIYTWIVTCRGRVDYNTTTDTYYGARAVVEISK